MNLTQENPQFKPMTRDEAIDHLRAVIEGDFMPGEPYDKANEALRVLSEIPPSEDRLRTALEREVDGWEVAAKASDHESIDGGPDFARGLRYAATMLRAALSPAKVSTTEPLSAEDVRSGRFRAALEEEAVASTTGDEGLREAVKTIDDMEPGRFSDEENEALDIVLKALK